MFFSPGKKLQFKVRFRGRLKKEFKKGWRLLLSALFYQQQDLSLRRQYRALVGRNAGAGRYGAGTG